MHLLLCFVPCIVNTCTLPASFPVTPCSSIKSIMGGFEVQTAGGVRGASTFVSYAGRRKSSTVSDCFADPSTQSAQHGAAVFIVCFT